jgi:hypothetical protein
MALYIFIISLLGFIASMVLVMRNKKNPDYCPKFGNVPACFMVALAYIFVSLSAILDLKWLSNLMFWGGSILGLFLGIWFSFKKLVKKEECPKFFIIPLCYVSFFVFALIIVLRLI